MGLEEIHQMKDVTLGALEFSLNSCFKTFLVEGQQPAFDILATNHAEQSNIMSTIVEGMERGLITTEFEIDFCKKLLAMNGSRDVIEDHIHKLETINGKMEQMNVRRDIRL
jgi:hypothetical protein